MNEYKEECMKRFIESQKYQKYDIEDLTDELYEKDKEIDRLKNIINEYENKGYDIAQERADFLLEIQRLNNIINELEKWLNEKWAKPLAEVYIADIVKKIIELKEENKDE